MIAYRNCDPRYPFYWEDVDQPPQRWHAAGEGPVQYLADSPDGAWAEFLRHEEITELEDLAGVHRAIWSVEIGEPPAGAPALGLAELLGGSEAYEACRAEAARLRQDGFDGLVAPSAALVPGPGGFRVNDGLRPAEPFEPNVIVLFGPRPAHVGWLVAEDGRPFVRLLARVRLLEE